MNVGISKARLSPRGNRYKLSPVTAEPSHAITLRNDRLEVTLARPGAMYRGSRFDWSGNVVQVELDGKHRFCAAEFESHDVSHSGKYPLHHSFRGGMGLCNEFAIDNALGFDEAGPGEWFVKPGVGLLKRPDRAAYNFAAQYECKPFRTNVRLDPAGRSVEFITHPTDCNGHAMELRKTVSIDGAMICTDYQLSNVGAKPVHCEEYNHNFLRLDRVTPGPGYRMTWGLPLETIEGSKVIAIDQTSARWTAKARRAELIRFDTPQRPTVDSVAHPWWWQLTCEPAGLGVRERTSRPWVRFHLFQTHRLLSPEAFIEIKLAPGEAMQWTREHEFFLTP